MSHMLSRAFKVSALAAVFGLMVGCATTDANLQAMVEEARQDAADAREEAALALATANEAKEIALNAESLAEAAQFSADRVAERQERVIEQGMYK